MRHTIKLLAIAATLLFSSFTGTDWIDFSPKDGQFKLKFPQQPAESEQNIPSDAGNFTMKIVMYEVDKQKDDNLAYAAMYVDYPDTLVNSGFKDEVVNVFFENAINGAVQNVKGKLISEEKIKHDGYPGREVKVDYGNGQAIINMRLYLVKNRAYFLQVICLTEKDNNSAINTFYNSFALKK